MNSLFVIKPYKYLTLWVFDDEKVRLIQEPFIAGADEIIDLMVKDIPNAKEGFVMFFSDEPFPGHKLELNWQREDGSGNWYRSSALDKEGWLCPALFRYFKETPKNLYADFKKN